MAHPQPSEAEWIKFKPILRELWESSTTAAIIKLMAERHAFQANKDSYDRHFKKWGWQKNLAATDWCKIDYTVKRRKRDQGKDSEVRLDGIVVEANDRLKRHRLSSLEQIKILSTGKIELPKAVTISTPRPVNDANGSASHGQEALERLPWVQFTKVLKKEARKSVVRALSLRQLTAEALFFSKWDLPVIVPMSATAALEKPAPSQQDEEESALRSLLGSFLADPDATPALNLSLIRCCVNAKHDLIEDEEYFQTSRCLNCKHALSGKGSLFDAIHSLTQEQRECLASLLIALPGPGARTLARAMLVAVFDLDDVSTARILLPKLRDYVNMPVSSDLLPRVGLGKRSKPVDAIRSLAMTRLFQEFGGALSEQYDPIRPLYLQYCDDTQGITVIHNSDSQLSRLLRLPHRAVSFAGSRADADAICKLFIEMEHPDVLSALPAILKCSTVENILLILPILQHCSSDLLHSALVWASLDHDTAKVAVISTCIRERLKKDGDNFPSAPVLAHAAFYGDLVTVRELLEQSAPIDVTATLLYNERDPMVGTALQFALLRKNFRIVRVLLESSAHAIVHAESNLPPPLALAFDAGDREIIELLLCQPDAGPLDEWSETKRSPNHLSDHSWTSLLRRKHICPLAIAASWGDRSLIEKLIKAGADLNQPLKEWTSKDPHFAVCEALKLGNVELALYLIERGARLTTPVQRGDLEWLYPKAQSCLTAIGHLLRLGKDTVDRFHVTGEDLGPCFAGRACCGRPLDNVWSDELVTAGECHPKLQALIDLGANINTTSFAETWLSRVLRAGCLDCLDILLANGVELSDDSAFFELGRTASLAAFTRLRSLISDAVNLKNAETLGDFSLSHLSQQTIRGILSRCQSAEDFGEESLALLRIAVTSLDASFAPCMFDIMVEACKIVQPEGSSPSGSDGFVVRIVKLLHHAGVPITGNPYVRLACCPCHGEQLPRFERDTPLWWSVQNDNMELLDFLLTAGALMDDPERHCWPALLLAAQKDNVEAMRRLIAAGGSAHRFTDDINESTVLQTAAEHQSLDIVRFLLYEQKVNPDEPLAGLARNPALWHAAFNGDLDMARELISAGAHVNARESEHEHVTEHRGDSFTTETRRTTALEIAARFGALDMVAYLIIAGADISGSAFGTEQFNNAMGYAQKAGHAILAEYLQEQRREMHGI